MRVLITGGAGYIGAHVAAALLEEGHFVGILDNFSRASRDALRPETFGPVPIHFCDVLDTDGLRDAFEKFEYDSVVHCAGLKSVPESNTDPVKYTEQNVGGLTSVLQVMWEYNVKKIVFSSSATVYSDAGPLPFQETNPTGPSSVYGHTKLYCETLLRASSATGLIDARILRYFNPIGARESLKESPHGVITNVMPLLFNASRSNTPFTVHGTDFPTKDGTAERDYIHVCDVADAHVHALRTEHGNFTVNIGTGNPVSVLSLVGMFNSLAKQPVSYIHGGRRAGDIAASYCDPSLAKSLLGWEAKFNLRDMCLSAIRSQGL